MHFLFLGLCIGLLPSLIVSLLIICKVNGESELLRERLAAEEVEITLLRSRALVAEAA